MIRKIICLLWLSIPLLCMAQNSLAFSYDYDAAGNRVHRKVIYVAPKTLPPPPEMPELAATAPVETETLMSLMSPKSQDLAEPYPEYFIENLAQVEIKIYPNPTTEKITLQISNMENLQTGTFKLFSINGQLLQEQPVHSATITVSLAGFSKGAYILKVHINHHTEDWKIIKQ
jgi:hypothetical protein